MKWYIWLIIALIVAITIYAIVSSYSSKKKITAAQSGTTTTTTGSQTGASEPCCQWCADKHKTAMS